MNDDNIQADSTVKAIAIKQDSAQSAPKLTAKGEGLVAERILDIAFVKGVKVRQDKDLTELLDAFDIESPVPLEALHAVSLILERVYAENNKLQNPAPNEQEPSNTNRSDDTHGTPGTPPNGDPSPW
jgi:flagellar biosynthesis protein